MTPSQRNEAERKKREWLDGVKSMKPSEVCVKYQVQQCHICDNLLCGDNQTPEAIRLRKEKRNQC